ncbi:MAG: LemA family protein [Halieaceae bacterium]|jgi:LemA protein|nr:LemA family protein [Halieaceae bacterium]
MGWLIALLAASAVGWIIWTYNRLVLRRNRVSTAWSDIDVQLTRRHDLIPNLVSAVKAYAAHESATLAAVTTLRGHAMAEQRPTKLGVIEGDIEKLLSRLLVLQEDYPELKADQNFAQLSDTLVEVEDQLQYARRYYNGAVRDLNTQIASFPDLIVATVLGFRQAEFYQAEGSHRDSVAVGNPGA